MGIFDSLRKRTSAVRFSYSFQLQSLSPWPANNGKAIAIAWQRGSKKKKRGVTEPHIPTQVPGQLGTIIHLNEVIQLSATLYMDGNMEPSPSGPFKKKCLILAVIENGAHHRDTNALGRVVIDLSEFASLESEVQRQFPVACSRNVLAAVGEPRLKMTVRSAWKSSGGPASMASSMSSDRTGGTFNTQFSAFVRGTENERIPIPLTGEQFEDLRGFDRLNTITEGDDQSLAEATTTDHQDHEDHEVGIHPNPVSSPDEDQASETVLQENKEIEKLRDEFCFLGSDDDDSNEETEKNRKSQDRTSSWLAGLALKLESPTIGLIDEKTGPPVKEPEEPEEEVKTPESQNHSNETQEADQRSERSLKLVMESSTSDQSEVESIIVEKQLLVDSDFDRRLQDDKETSKTPPDPDSFPQDIQPKSKTFERRWKRATNPKDTQTTTAMKMMMSGFDQTKTPSPSPQTTAFRTPPPPLHREVRSPPPSSSNQETIPQKRSTFPSHRDGPSSTHAASSLLIEVQTAAFLEYAIYLARPSPQKYTSRNVHGPSKRILQGLMLHGLTSNESLNLLQNCLQAMKIMIDGCSSDVPGMSFWWSNCFQLRLLLTHHFTSIWSSSSSSSMNHHLGVEISQNSNTSLMDSINENQEWEFRRMVQLVLKMERSIFDRLQQYLWWKVMIPMILKMTSGTPFGKFNTSSSSTSNSTLSHHQYNESGVQLWLNALTRVYEEFGIRSSKTPGDQGHLPLLRQKLIFNYCRLMDSMLFKELLTSAYHNKGNLESSSSTSVGLEAPWDSFRDDNLISQTMCWPKLDPSVLPFKQGPLNFGVGMHLKMAVTQWSEWILLESNFKQQVQTGDPGQCLFPLLKASADVLMMPKELLTDSGVRGELFSALSLKSLCILLEKFQPDEFAPDPVDPEVLRSLTERLQDSPDSTGDPMTSPKLLEPPFEATLDFEEADYDHHHQGPDHPDHAFDGESEVALEALMKALPSIDNSISRFEILKNQWKQNTKH